MTASQVDSIAMERLKFDHVFGLFVTNAYDVEKSRFPADCSISEASNRSVLLTVKARV